MFERTPEDIARQGTERVVHDLLRAEHGPGALVQRPLAEGLSAGFPAPADYTAGIAAARRVADHADRLVDGYARKARGQGVAWRDLAGALGVGEEEDPAAAAFEAIVGQPLRQFDERSVGWSCDSCGQHITDRGPYNGHPEDNELGHADDCARHQAEIAEYERGIE